METIHLVQAFSRGKRGALVADKPQQYKTAQEAERRATRMVESVAGVLAYAMEVDEESGEYGAPQVLFTAGEVPEL
ncbi:MAG: hypothetical protein ABW154_07855 [Dyella sp.]